MKELIIFSALLGALCFSLKLPYCPEPEPDAGAVHLPNPDDCSTFYQCAGPVPKLLECFPGTWFSPEAGVCDWPINVPEGACTPPPLPPQQVL